MYINNFSIICSLGSCKHEIANKIFSNSPIRRLNHYSLIDGQTTPIMEVKEELPRLPEGYEKFNSRNNQLVLFNLLELKDELDLLVKKYGKNRIGVIFGTSTSGISEGIEAIKNETTEGLPSDFHFEVQEMGSPSDFIKNYLDLSSICYTISTACTSSSRTFIEAKNLLDCDICDAVIVGGSDTLNELTLNGFHSLEAISTNLTNPFSTNRNGINIGEGSTVFILSKEKSEIEILGMGESSDAYHISSPDPSGAGAVTAIKMALNSANLTPNDIHYLNLHGTGTIKNDSMEAIAVSTIFENNIPVSSTKPFTGHTLGAAGGIELALCILCLDPKYNPQGYTPLHICDNEFDQELPHLNFQIEKNKIFPKICMSNSYAFGGNNVSLIIGRSQ